MLLRNNMRKIMFASAFAVLLIASCCGHGSVKEPADGFTDMILCYGGSPNRGALNKWDAERFSTLVSYTDTTGKAHWLFDGFLAIEPRLFGRSSDPVDVCLSQEDMGGWHESGRKEHWQELIDFWFAPDNGFAELDKAIDIASRKLGKAPYKRKVVMNLPDAVMHRIFEDTLSTTVYWGSYEGRKLDFSRPEDRAAACRWYIDAVDSTFKAAKFRNIELIGFYIHCEELPTPTKGWRWPWKKMDTYLPMVADYLHSKGLKLTWIPYREAASYDSPDELGIDLCWMQPNYYWEGDKYPFDASMKMITDNDLGMEFEFDDRLLSSSPQHQEQRRRFALYYDWAKASGVYGTKTFTHFQDHDNVRNLALSDDPDDQRLYHEYCSFIINNPLRK